MGVYIFPEVSAKLARIKLEYFVAYPRRDWHDGQRQIMGTKKYIGKIQPFTWCWVKRACVSVTRWSVQEFAFCRLGVTTAHMSWLAQLECRVLVGAGGSVDDLIGQSACRLLACARAEIDSTRARARGSLHAATTNPLNIRIKLFFFFFIQAQTGRIPTWLWWLGIHKGAVICQRNYIRLCPAKLTYFGFFVNYDGRRCFLYCNVNADFHFNLINLITALNRSKVNGYPSKNGNNLISVRA